MHYPLPIDAAGRTVLVILGLAFLRCEGAFLVGGLLGLRVRPCAWLDDCARFGPGRAAGRLSIAVARGVGGISLAIVFVLWVLYALARLADDFAVSPTLTAVGSSLGVILCRVAR
jgi:hypothetical protein